MEQEIGPKLQLETTKESCFVTDQTNSVSRDALREPDLNHLTLVLPQASHLDGIQLWNCSQEMEKRNVSYFKFNWLPLLIPGDPNSILVRHRKFLKQLEAQKNLEKEEVIEAQNEAERKKANFRNQAAKQRDKIKTMKAAEVDMQNEEALEDAPISVSSKPDKLTAANLKAHSVASSKKCAAKKSGKPAWAQTAEQMEEEKEAEIDSLLEFAYELDYEKYMEDYEVRQALAIIKDRVNEMTKEEDWKEKMADEWNKAAEQEKIQRRAEKRAE